MANNTKKMDYRGNILSLITHIEEIKTSFKKQMFNTMDRKPVLEDIIIRTALRPGDMGYITYLHGHLYSLEYNYGLSFEAYVLQGLNEFYQHYNAEKDGVWICEHNDKIVGALMLVNRGTAAQLRYFILDPAYRGIGLGKKLMELFMDFLKSHDYQSAYLWTTQEQQTAALIYKKHGFKLTEERDSATFGKQLTEQRYDLFCS